MYRIPPFTPHPAADTEAGKAVAVTTIRALACLPLWCLQYGLYVWAAYAWRLTGVLFRTVGFAAVLLFVPVIGWLILWAVLRGRKRDRQHTELVRAVRGDTTRRRSLWTPWAYGWVKAPLTA